MIRVNPPQDIFRIWIARFADWQPGTWQDLPDEAVVLELAAPGWYDAHQAMAYIEGHNRAAIQRADDRWAVAVPVRLTYQGDPRPGETISPRRLTERAWRA